MSKPKIKRLSPSVVSRQKGCWNCLHYQTGESVEKRFREIQRSESVISLESQNAEEAKLTASQIEDETRKLFTQTELTIRMFVRTGKIGQCIKGIPEGEFVEGGYLCETWSGRDGHSLARHEGANDELPEHLMKERN